MASSSKIIATVILVAAAGFVALVAIACQHDKTSENLNREMAKIKIVRLLKANGGMSANEISKEMGSGRGAYSTKQVTSMVNELVKEGKVTSQSAGSVWSRFKILGFRAVCDHGAG